MSAAALAVFLVLVPPSAGPLAAQQCDGDRPSISAEQRDAERVDLYVEVPGHASMVVRLQVDMVNMQADRRLPHVATYRAGRRTRAVTLRAMGGQRWNYRYSYTWAWGDHRAVHDDSYRYRLPFPEEGAYRLAQGPDGAFSHGGKHAYDWGMPEGTPVLAAREGVVVATCDIHRVGGAVRAFLDRANYVHVQHADGTIGVYVHLMPDGARVKPGDRVSRGELLGLSGNTGFSQGPHLHFEVMRRGADLELESVPITFEREP